MNLKFVVTCRCALLIAAVLFEIILKLQVVDFVRHVVGAGCSYCHIFYIIDRVRLGIQVYKKDKVQKEDILPMGCA